MNHTNRTITPPPTTPATTTTTTKTTTPKRRKRNSSNNNNSNSNNDNRNHHHPCCCRHCPSCCVCVSSSWFLWSCRSRKRRSASARSRGSARAPPLFQVAVALAVLALSSSSLPFASSTYSTTTTTTNTKTTSLLLRLSKKPSPKGVCTGDAKLDAVLQRAGICLPQQQPQQQRLKGTSTGNNNKNNNNNNRRRIRGALKTLLDDDDNDNDSTTTTRKKRRIRNKLTRRQRQKVESIGLDRYFRIDLPVIVVEEVMDNNNNNNSNNIHQVVLDIPKLMEEIRACSPIVESVELNAVGQGGGIGGGGGEGRRMTTTTTTDLDVFSSSSPPSDTYYKFQWNLHNDDHNDSDVDANEAWSKHTTGSSSVIMAVLDTGMDSMHPEFQGRLVEGYDFVNDDNDDPYPHADHPHGMYTSGIAVANGNNNFGIAGVDWHAKLMPLKVLDENNEGFLTDLADALVYAANNGANVISMRLINYPKESQILGDALNYALEEGGCILVAAAGNGGDGNADESGPGCYPQTISVGATNAQDSLTSTSGTGASLHVVAPGQSVPTVNPELTDESGGNFVDGYHVFSGTSAACPIVAGTISLMLALQPLLTQTQALRALQETSKDLGPVGRDDAYGYGRINTAKALEYVADNYVSKPTLAPTPPPGGPPTLTPTAPENPTEVTLGPFLQWLTNLFTKGGGGRSIASRVWG